MSFPRLIGIFFLSLCLRSAVGQIPQQAMCARIVSKDIERTRTERPKVYATIQHYTFEWSPKHRSCVIVIQYRTHDAEKPPEVQVLALNAITMQPMEGATNIFLIPASQKKEIDDATNFLFERFSH